MEMLKSIVLNSSIKAQVSKAISLIEEVETSENNVMNGNIINNRKIDHVTQNNYM